MDIRTAERNWTARMDAVADRDMDRARALDAAADRIYERLNRMPLGDAVRALPNSIGQDIDELLKKAYDEMAEAELATAARLAAEDRAADRWERRHH